VSFGATLRAYRLGYRISEKRGAFVRLADNPDGKTVNVTLVPRDRQVPRERGMSKEHRCWWESPIGGEALLDMIPAIRNVKKVKRTISFDVDFQTGERITK